MEVYLSGAARIRRRVTGEIHEIESDELNWMQLAATSVRWSRKLIMRPCWSIPSLGS
jgi:hypothetical protein